MNVGELSVKIGLDQSDFDSALAGVESKVGNLGKTIQGALSVAGGVLLAQGIQAVGTALVGAFSATTTFEQGIANINAVLAPTTAQLDALRAKALELGAATSFSANESAGAIEILATQGMSTEQILGGVLAGTLALAAATGTDLNTAASVASDALLSFNLQASDMSAVVDGITGVTAASKFTIDDYRLALSNGGGAAAAFGVSLDEFNAVIAATSNQFASGQTAGTAFRTFINRLTPSSKAAKDAMAELNLVTADGSSKFYDAQGNLKSMGEVAGIVQSAFSGLTEAQRAGRIETIFGSEAIGTVIGLMNQGTAGVNEYAAAIANTSAADQAAMRLDSFQGASEALNGSLETLGITLGSAVLPAITGFVQSLTGAVNYVNLVSQAIFGSQAAFAQLSPAVQTVISIIQELGSYFNSLASAASSWGAAIGTNFADGIISAASAVVDALMQMGSVISYWLTPGSPPPLLPNLDMWGRDAAQVYLDSWSTADFSSLQTMGNSVKDVLTSLFKSGSFAEKDIIPAVLGSREAFSAAIEQLRTTGSVGSGAIADVVRAAGSAGTILEPLITSFFQAEQAAYGFAAAQEELTAAQGALNDLIAEYDAKLDPLKDKLSDLRDEEDALDRADRIKELQDDLSNVGDTAEDALSPLQKQMKQIKRQQKAFDLDKQIAEYKEKTLDTNPEYAQAAALKLSELELEKQELTLQDQIDAEKEKENLRKRELEDRKKAIELERLLLEEKIAAVEVEKEGATTGAQARVVAAQEVLVSAQAAQAIAQEQFKLEQARVGALKEQNALIQEQMKLMEGASSAGGGGGGGGGGKTAMSDAEKEALAAQKAQEAYNFNLADTDGKLAILKERLAGVKEGSAEYYQLLGQIGGLEKTKADAQSQIANAAAQEAERRAKAEFQYQMQTTDTAGKLALLRGALGEVEVGSAEYFNILGQIASLEAQAAREAENLAKGVKGAGSAGSVAAGGLGALAGKLPPIKAGLDGAATGAADFMAQMNQLPMSYGNAATPASTFAGLMTGLQPILAPISALFTTIGQALTGFFGPAFQIASDIIGGTTLPLLTQLGQAFIDVFQTNAGPIIGAFKVLMEDLAPLFEIVKLGIAGFVAGALTLFNGFIGFFVGAMPGIGMAFTGFVQVLTNGLGLSSILIGGFIDFFANLIAGNWAGAWEVAKTLVFAAIGKIGSILSGLVTLGIGLFSALAGGIVGFVAGMWETVTGNTSTAIAETTEFFQMLRDKAIGFIYDMVGGIIGFFKNLFNELVGNSIVPDMVIAILKWFTDLKDKALEFVQNLVTNGIIKFNELKDKAIDAALALKDRVVEHVTTLASKVKEYIENAARDGLAAATTLKDTVIEKFTELKDKAIEKVKAIPGEIGKLASTFTTNAKDIGAAIIDGIVKGIEGGVRSIINAAKDAATSAFDAAKKALGIQSPSTLFRDEVGGNIIQGLADGLSMTAPVTRAMNNLTSDIGGISVGGSMGAMGMNSGGSGIVINMDLRGSSLTRPEVENIVRSNFVALGKRLNTL